MNTKEHKIQEISLSNDTLEVTLKLVFDIKDMLGRDRYDGMPNVKKYLRDQFIEELLPVIRERYRDEIIEGIDAQAIIKHIKHEIIMDQLRRD